MYIKTQRNTLSLIRTRYCREKKRGVQTSVGSLPSTSTTVPAEIEAKLTAEELAHLKSHLKALAEERAIQKRADMARNAYREVGSLRKAAESGVVFENPEELKEELNRLFEALQKQDVDKTSEGDSHA